MSPVLHGVTPVADAVFEAIQNQIGWHLPAAAKAAIRAVNDANPQPKWVRIAIATVDGRTEVPVYEFFNVASIDYVRICLSHWNDLGVPRRFVPFAAADADTFYLDIESPKLRVMLWEYLEGDYGSHFQGEEMDCIADSVTEFMESFFDRDERSHC